MTHTEFLSDLEACLRSRFAVWDRGELLAFVESCWPLCEDHPDPAFWAAEYLANRVPAAGR